MTFEQFVNSCVLMTPDQFETENHCLPYEVMEGRETNVRVYDGCFYILQDDDGALCLPLENREYCSPEYSLSALEKILFNYAYDLD